MRRIVQLSLIANAFLRLPAVAFIVCLIVSGLLLKMYLIFMWSKTSSLVAQ